MDNNEEINQVMVINQATFKFFIIFYIICDYSYFIIIDIIFIYLFLLLRIFLVIIIITLLRK